MISFNRDPAVTAALQQWRGRTVWPTEFGSADLRGFSRELMLRSVFSARTTNAEYLQEVAHVIDECLAGRINIATARWMLMKKLKQLGYDPATGFPQDMAAVPPAEAGTLQDLSSEQRIDLMLKTNIALARNYGRAVGGNTEFARYAWPAWELVRIELRHTPRGERRGKEGALVADPEHGWPARWEAAAESVGWEGALHGRLMARKDSPIWQALADGVGGYGDTLGHPFPPFAFNSGMDWRSVKRAEWLALEGDAPSSPGGGEPPKGGTTSFAPTEEEVAARYEALSPDLKEALHRRLGIA
jgi:hypothetical protein